MRHCCLFGCKNTTKVSKNSFFKFPIDEHLKKEWIIRVGLSHGRSSRVHKIHNRSGSPGPVVNSMHIADVGLTFNDSLSSSLDIIIFISS